MRFSPDEKYKLFNSKLVTTKYPILGVRVPILRAYAKQVLKTNEWKEIINEKPHYHEDIQLKAFIIAAAPMELKHRQQQLEALFPYLDNWQTVDGLCSSLKEVKKNKSHYWNWLSSLRGTNEPFVLRFIIVIYLTYFLDDYLDDILNYLQSVKSNHYYVKMAIAWAVSIAYIKNEEKVITFLNETKMDDWTYNKALQKIIESTQISNEKKVKIKRMKK